MITPDRRRGSPPLPAVLAIATIATIAIGLRLTDQEPGVTASPTPAVAPVVSATARPTESAAPAAAAASPSPIPRPIPDGYRVLLPRLRIDLPVREGDVLQDVVNEQTPENAAFHFPGTSLPGDGSNTYVYAHARTGMFLSLWNVRVGDEVIVLAPDGAQLRYLVSEVHPRVPPTDTNWLGPTPSERLTLQTSTGPSSNDPRFIVVAVPKAP